MESFGASWSYKTSIWHVKQNIQIWKDFCVWSERLPHCLFHFWLPASLNMNQVENDFKIDKGLHKSFPTSHCHGNNPLRHEIVCWTFLFVLKLQMIKIQLFYMHFYGFWQPTLQQAFSEMEHPRGLLVRLPTPDILSIFEIVFFQNVSWEKISRRTILASLLFLGKMCWQALHANACGKHSSYAVGSATLVHPSTR